MKKILSIIFVLALASFAQANTTKLLGPTANGGRPSNDSISNQRIDTTIQRAIGDCTNGAAFATTATATSIPVSLTNTGVTPATASASGYAGKYTFYVVNNGLADIIIFASMTATAMTNANQAGVVIKGGYSGSLDVQARTGLTLHMVGLTATTGTCSWSLCTY